MRISITTEMHEILKLRLQGLSAYRIARKLTLDPPMVYASLKAAKTNFAKIDKMIDELKSLGWPEKLAIVETQNIQRAKERKTIVRKEKPETPVPSEEIPIKLG